MNKLTEKFQNYIPPDWDEFFMRTVYLTALKSKDTRTKIGSVIVKDKRVISTGYNGICGGVNDNIMSRYNLPEKYIYFEHSERNSIYQCAKHGTSCNGATMYSQGISCTDCARAIIQSGIKEFVVHKQWEDKFIELASSTWRDGIKHSIEMFNESNVNLRYFDKFLSIDGYCGGFKIKI